MTARTGSPAVGMALAAALAVAGTAHAQQKIVLKASDVHAAGYPTVAAVENMGKKLETATGGRLAIAMFPSMQLGGEKESIEQAQVGAIALARVSVGALGPVIEDLNVFNLPFFPQHRAYGKSDRRADRSRAARQGDEQSQGGSGRPVLDGRGRALSL